MKHIAFDERAFRVALANAGIRSVAELGRRVERSTSYLRQVAHGTIPSAAVRTILANALGVDEREIWRSLETARPRLAAVPAHATSAGGRR
jgi:lambda repressor-like predicted transcriptional regulator